MEQFGDIGIIADQQAVVKFTKNASSRKNKEEKPTEVVLYTENKKATIAAWGSNNKFPQELMESVRKNGVVTSGLGAVRDNHYGSGFILFKETYEEEKRKLIQKPLIAYPKIFDFFRVNQMKKIYKEIVTDLEYFSIAFPEYILSADCNKIHRVTRKKAAHCRFELMNEKGVIENVWISTKWHTNVDLNSVYAADVPFISPYWSADQVKEHCKEKGITKFIRPIHYAMLDENYYPVATWHSAYYSQWIEVANSIPEFKKALFENQSTIKFHIEIDEEYFLRKYEDKWNDYSIKEKTTIQQKFAKFLDESLRGKKNTAKSIWSTIYSDDEGKRISGVKITPIDDKLKDGAFLPDGEVANKENLAAIGMDSCIISSGTVGGTGAGSGSDKRVAWNILSLRSRPKRETTLEIFEFIQQYNTWEKELVGAFEDTSITTLDNNPTGTQQTANV